MEIQCKTSKEISGMGHSMKRKEDARFIQGHGRYIDDIKLPGMLYMDIVRSPYAYAKIKSINAEKALAIPGVLAVVTGKDLEKYKLHWMPTIMSDTQMVLPTDTVMYQAQEVAAVIATERYIAADGADAVEVEYEPMKPIVDPHKSLDKDAPLLRPDKQGKTDNHIWHWEVGDRETTDDVFANAEVKVKEQIYIPRIHVASIETCGCVADYDKDRKQTHDVHDHTGTSCNTYCDCIGSRSCWINGRKNPGCFSRYWWRFWWKSSCVSRLCNCHCCFIFGR